jgi:hypothetical protein
MVGSSAVYLIIALVVRVAPREQEEESDRPCHPAKGRQEMIGREGLKKRDGQF